MKYQHRKKLGEYAVTVFPKLDGLLLHSIPPVKRGILVSKNKHYWIIPFTAKNLDFIRVNYPEHYEQANERIEERERVKKLYKTKVKEYHKDLMDFQREGVAFCVESLKINKGVLLADEMGLGKTFQALTVLNELQPEKTLVVCPNSVKQVWKEEAEKWYGFNFDIDALGSTNLIVNYEKLIAKSFAEYLTKVNWDLVILDEAHRVKNIRAKKTRALNLHILKKETKILLLTGTPIYNRPDDLFSLLYFCSPERFPRKLAFVEDYLKYHILEIKRPIRGETRTIQVFKVTGIKDQKSFYEDTKDLIIRRERKEVLKELPEKTVENRIVEMTPIQKELYSQAETDVILELSNSIFDVSTAIVRLGRLKQLAISPYLIEDTEEYAFSPKVDELVEIYFDTGTKLLCFSRYKKALTLAKKILTERKIPSVIISGDTPVKERLEIISRFEKEKEGILLGTIDSIGEGVNLQHCSNIAVFLDLDFTVSKNEQIEDRIARIGQVKKPLIIRIMANAGIDYYTLVLLKEKKSLATEILKGNTLKYFKRLDKLNI